MFQRMPLTIWVVVIGREILKVSTSRAEARGFALSQKGIVSVRRLKGQFISPRRERQEQPRLA